MRLDPNYQVCGQCLANTNHDEPPAPASLVGHAKGTQTPLPCMVRLVEARGCAFNINMMRLDPNYKDCGQCLANSNHDDAPAPVTLVGPTDGT